MILITTNVFSSVPSGNTNLNERKLHKIKHISVGTFEKNIDKIYKEINNKKVFNSRTCNAYISQITDFLLFKGGEAYLPFNQNDFKILEKRSFIIVNKLFHLRLLLRKKLKEFYAQGNISQVCINKIRKAFRYSRFLEEFITEVGISMQKKPFVSDPRDYSQQKYQFYVNPKYKSFHFQSGDILLTRSSSFLSAIIARIGDEDGQFSHGAMIYVDKKGEVQVIEALIHAGVVITPYEKWRERNHHSRALIFRHPDKKLAKNAAQKLYNDVQERWANNDPILYDFGMDDSNANQFFCSEIIQYAFHLAGETKLPTFSTSFKSFNHHTFVSDMTIKVDSAFSPGDLEIEPEINFVAEWRDYNRTSLTRIQDVVQTKIFYWMTEKGYYLQPTFKSFMSTNIALIGRNLFGYMDDKIPLNMPYGFLENIIKLEAINKVLEKYLVDVEAEYFNKHGHSMDYFKMMQEMEQLRIKDCETYISRHNEMIEKLHDSETLSEDYKTPKPIFHDLFNTENRLQCNL